MASAARAFSGSFFKASLSLLGLLIVMLTAAHGVAVPLARSAADLELAADGVRTG